VVCKGSEKYSVYRIVQAGSKRYVFVGELGMFHEVFTVILGAFAALVVGSVVFRFLVLPWVYRALGPE
jgi:hypothetical protein